MLEARKRKMKLNPNPLILQTPFKSKILMTNFLFNRTMSTYTYIIAGDRRAYSHISD